MCSSYEKAKEEKSVHLKEYEVSGMRGLRAGERHRNMLILAQACRKAEKSLQKLGEVIDNLSLKRKED